MWKNNEQLGVKAAACVHVRKCWTWPSSIQREMAATKSK